jgi:hypothetical protein
VLLVIGIQVLKAMTVVGYVAMVLEQELGLRSAPLVTSFMLRLVHGTIPAGPGSFPDVTDADLQKSLFSARARTVLAGKPAYIMYAISVAQLGLFIISAFVYHFDFM